MKQIHVKVTEFSTTPKQSVDQVSFTFDKPYLNYENDAPYLELSGWVFGKGVTVSRLVVVNESRNHLIRNVPLSINRADVEQHFKQWNPPLCCGFKVLLSTIGLANRTTLRIQALLNNTTPVEIAVITLERTQKIRSTYTPKYQPLLVTSLGRSGSTWLMHLLGQSEKVALYEAYPYEAYASKYWLYTILKVLSEPTNYLATASPDDLFNFNVGWSRRDLYLPSHRQWFYQDYLQNAIQFCQHSIDSFYQQALKNQGQTKQAIYFAEKFGTWYANGIFHECYDQCKEILLVRDFRDMLCSMQAFTKKRGSEQVQGFSINLEKEEISALQGVQKSAQALYNYWQENEARILLIRYEDLLQYPETTLKEILSYLALPNTNEVITKMLKQAARETAEMKTHKTSKSPLQSIGRWQHDLSDNMQQLCQTELVPILKAFGYETN